MADERCTLADYCHISQIDKEIAHWAENWISDDLQEQLESLRKILMEYNSSKYNLHLPSTTWKIIEIFTPERLKMIKRIETEIRQRYVRTFEYKWIDAMESAFRLAQERLKYLMLNHTHVDLMTVCLYDKKRTILQEKVHDLLDSTYVNLMFTRWQPFDVKLDKRSNKWLFVFTDSSKYISKMLKYLTEHKAYELPRTLEWAFRSLLGDYKDFFDENGQYEQNCHDWLCKDGGVSDKTMQMWFMSCHDI